MAKEKRDVKSQKLNQERFRSLNLFNLFYILALLVSPLYVIFIGGEIFSKLFLSFYLLIFTLLAFLMINYFIQYFVKFIDQKDAKLGQLFHTFIFYLLIPLALFKLIGYMVIRILPKAHEGIFCDLTCYVRDIYFIFDYQDVLDYLIVFSFIFVLALVFWKIARR